MCYCSNDKLTDWQCHFWVTFFIFIYLSASFCEQHSTVTDCICFRHAAMLICRTRVFTVHWKLTSNWFSLLKEAKTEKKTKRETTPENDWNKSTKSPCERHVFEIESLLLWQSLTVNVLFRSLYCAFISLYFNGHFPGEPRLAGVYWSKGWWRWWWQLDYWSY